HRQAGVRIAQALRDVFGLPQGQRAFACGDAQRRRRHVRTRKSNRASIASIAKRGVFEQVHPRSRRHSFATQHSERCPRVVQVRSALPRKLNAVFDEKESTMKKLPLITATLLATMA